MIVRANYGDSFVPDASQTSDLLGIGTLSMGGGGTLFPTLSFPSGSSSSSGSSTLIIAIAGVAAVLGVGAAVYFAKKGKRR